MKENVQKKSNKNRQNHEETNPRKQATKIRKNRTKMCKKNGSQKKGKNVGQ